MRYKPKNTAALQIALGGLPDKMRVQVEPGIAVSAKTVSELREVAMWPANVVVATPVLDPESRVTVSKATVAARTSPKP